MWIERFRLKSYASFEDSDWVSLNPGFNLFVGANNSGKTSLLRAFSQHFENLPHRNASRMRGADLTASKMEIDISVPLSELLKRFSIANQRAVFSVDRNNERILNAFLSDANRICEINAFRSAGKVFSARFRSSIQGIAGEQGNVQQCYVEPSGDHFKIMGYTGEADNLCNLLNFPEYPYVFYFEPQRLHVGSAPYSDQRALDARASNLPNILLHLQASRPQIFRKIVSYVSEISQSINSISAAPSGAQIEIILWPTDDHSRPELSFRLAESGTGIGQIIAIITAAATNDQCTIVIDEINSFLHPAATKRLISILKSEFGQHQYIISTHSSDVVSSVGSETINLIRKKNFQSKIYAVSSKDVSGVRAIASALGFSMMDVFGHDRLVWVEGETEQLVFPFILRASAKQIPEGLGFSTVAATSDFDLKKRSVKSITEMYQHIATSAAPLLRGLAFGLDRENHSDDAVQKLEKSKRKLRFLPRRTLENYALNPNSVAAAMSEADGQDISGEDVKHFLEANGGNREFGAATAWTGDLASEAWLKKVDAPKMLEKCFKELTETRTEYRKTRDTLRIIQHTFVNEPALLKSLIDYVDLLISTALRDTSA